MRPEDLIAKKAISKGWSCDQKYCVTTRDGAAYLLRVTPFQKSGKRVEMFHMQQKASELGIPMCRPVEIGACEDGVYILQTWIDGEDAEEVLPKRSDAEQYEYGLEAGRILCRLHTLPAPSGLKDWKSRYGRKLDYKIRTYDTCPIKYENGQAFLRCIHENRHLLRDRPQTFQHGDYHIGNMMIDRSGKLQIIDFDRCDFGDPWEEFNRIVWCAQKAPLFACGMIDGYFNGNVPPEFWSLLALYISCNTLASVAWAIPFGRGQVNVMLDQASEVLAWYNDMSSLIPAWYQKSSQIYPE